MEKSITALTILMIIAIALILFMGIAKCGLEVYKEYKQEVICTPHVKQN